MKNPITNTLSAVLMGLLLASGSAQAQFKAPTKSPGKDGLGSGIGSGAAAGPAAATATPATPAAPAAPATGVTPAQPAGPAEGKESAEKVVQEIANCMLAGLPADWTLAQAEVTELGRTDKQREFEATYSYKDGAGKAAPFSPCDPREPAMNIYKLNGALDPAKRNWVRATLVLSKEGKFELQYDYDKPGEASSKKPAPADPKKGPAKK